MTPAPSREHILALARQTLTIEAQALQGVQAKLGDAFVQAVQTILSVSNRTVLHGQSEATHTVNLD